MKKNILIMLISMFGFFLNVYSQVSHGTTDGKFEVYTNGLGNVISAKNHYDFHIGFTFEYVVSKISKKDKKIIEQSKYTTTGCVEPNRSSKRLINIPNGPYGSDYYYEVTYIYVKKFDEVSGCR